MKDDFFGDDDELTGQHQQDMRTKESEAHKKRLLEIGVHRGANEKASDKDLDEFHRGCNDGYAIGCMSGRLEGTIE